MCLKRSVGSLVSTIRPGEGFMKRLVGVMLLGLTACTGFEAAPTTLTSGTSDTSVSVVGEDSTDVSEDSSMTTIGGLPEAPWSGDMLASADVDSLLLDVWSGAANRGYCSLLAPVRLGPEGENAVSRQAGFGPDTDWYIAWDNPDGPGMTGESALCEDCGRSAFGVHGVDILTDGETVRWSDGSGLAIHPQAGSYADGHRRVLGNLSVAGQPCFYQVWSSFGEEHLLWFVDQLRFVDGYFSEPIEVGLGEVVVTKSGDPPWDGTQIDPTDVDSLLLESWEQTEPGIPEDGGCPLMAFADMGDELDSAVIRTARMSFWTVAWDNPDGPGHDGTNQNCSVCGRGVVGLGGGPGRPEQIPPDLPDRVEWDDGSVATYGYQGPAYLEIPIDRIDERDPNTGEPVTPPLHAWLVTADDPDCLIEMWTHLGEDHLHYLFSQLRYVTGHP